MARNSTNQRELDKWAKNLVKDMNKSLGRAARQNPSRVPVQFGATTDGGVVAGGEAVESNAYLARLLLWLDEQTALQPGRFINAGDFAEQVDVTGEEARVLSHQLSQRGLVKALRTFGDEKIVMVTDDGRVEVRRLRTLQNDHLARLRYTVNALLPWVFTATQGQSPVIPADFLSTPDAAFAGAPLSSDDLDQALAQLARQQLIEFAGTHPETITITTAGIDRALSGAPVTAYPDQPRTGTTYNNFLPNAQGVIIGDQQHVTQNNTSGIDPSAFVQLAGYVGQISSTLGMSEPDRVELERVAQELHAEASSTAPEPGRMRQLATQLKDKLVDAGTTIAATMGVQMAEQALGTLV
ncbi:hypothetical protein WEB32_00225 [Streptomyces netropsis]|uniref:hypothetical protein n=1 Tax=Streptomyces netropsis TaxID=55404 RepID=UPI0030CDDF59